ncbi:MAG: hypothetical protein IT372_06015 [Polyangiaceae bacterium]|nr:hypothetical protein [Polyangiaceae bacterium]
MALCALCVAPGCTQDHDLLGKDPPATTTSGTGGAGGEPGTGGGGAGGAGPEEPPGPTKLTVVHGVNDLEAIKICFLAFPGGTGAGVSPWPSGAGLGFARGKVVDPIGSVIPAGSSVQPHVLGGDLGAIAGLDCEEALALAGSGGPVTAAALPVLPESVFEAERSLLLVPMGCAGGPGHTDPAQEAICGPGYTESTPTVTLAAAAMSRLTTAGKVGFQVLHASAAMPAVDVRITAGTSGAPEAQLAPGLTPGAIGPFPPFSSLGSVDLGVVAAVTLRTYPPGEQTSTSALMLGDALAHSDVQAADIVEGKNFVLVAVGAAPGTASGPFWHALTYALVKADP